MPTVADDSDNDDYDSDDDDDDDGGVSLLMVYALEKNEPCNIINKSTNASHIIMTYTPSHPHLNLMNMYCFFSSNAHYVFTTKNNT